MKKLLSVLDVAALVISVICLMTITASATDAPITEPVTEVVTEVATEPATEAFTEPTTAPATESVTEPMTTAAQASDDTEPIYTLPIHIPDTTPVTEPANVSDADLARWLANKYNITLDEAYKTADNMISIADATLGTDNPLTKVIVTLKGNPVLLVVAFISVSMIAGAAVLFVKSRFVQSQTSKMILTDYVNPSKNSFDAISAAMGEMKDRLAKYDEVISTAAKLAAESDRKNEQIKLLTEQNVKAEKQRTDAYNAEMKSSVLFAATFAKYLQVTNVAAGRKDEIMNCFLQGLNGIETAASDPTILAAIAGIKKEIMTGTKKETV